MADELAGFTVGVTADRRRDELAALLERRGARVVLAPALRIVPLADDTELRDGHPGLPGPAAGHRDGQHRHRHARLAGGGRGLGAGRAAARGARPARTWSPAGPRRAARSGPPACTTSGRRTRRAARRWCDHLRRRGRGRRQVIAVQLHGDRQPEFTAALRGRRGRGDRGAGLPLGAAGRPGAAAPPGRPDRRPAGRRGHVHLRPGGRRRCCARPGTGPTTRAGGAARRRAGRLRRRRSPPRRCVRRGVPVQRAEPGPARRAGPHDRRRAAPPDASRVRVAGHLLTLRGHAAVVDGELRPLAPAPMAVLRALAARPGRVLSRTALLPHAAPGRRRARGGDGRGPAAGRPGRAPRGADRGQARLPAPGGLDRSGPAAPSPVVEAAPCRPVPGPPPHRGRLPQPTGAG